MHVDYSLFHRSTAICSDSRSDPDGDGMGWEGNQLCLTDVFSGNLELGEIGGVGVGVTVLAAAVAIPFIIILAMRIRRRVKARSTQDWRRPDFAVAPEIHEAIRLKRQRKNRLTP